VGAEFGGEGEVGDGLSKCLSGRAADGEIKERAANRTDGTIKAFTKIKKLLRRTPSGPGLIFA